MPHSVQLWDVLRDHRVSGNSLSSICLHFSSHLYVTHRNKYKNVRVSYQCVIWAGQKGRVAALTTAQALFVCMRSLMLVLN